MCSILCSFFLSLLVLLSSGHHHPCCIMHSNAIWRSRHLGLAQSIYKGWCPVKPAMPHQTTLAIIIIFVIPNQKEGSGQEEGKGTFPWQTGVPAAEAAKMLKGVEEPGEEISEGPPSHYII